MHNSISVILPTYNEKENIEKIIKEINKVFLKSRIKGKIVVVDDNSPDGTGKIVENLSKKYNTILITRKNVRGYGSASIRGINYSLKNLHSDLIFTMDSDFSHDPSIIPKFINKIMEGNDVVIGSRYVKGGRVSWTIYRRIISKGANLLASIVLGLKAKDVTTGYRCYKRKALEDIELGEINSEGYSFLQEILYKCQQKGYKIGETPIYFKDRREGKSKLSKIEYAKFFINLVKLRLGS